MILRKHLVMYRVYRHILNIIFHCLFLYILGTHLTYKVVCYSKYSTLNSSYFLYFCLSLTLSSFSHLSLSLSLFYFHSVLDVGLFIQLLLDSTGLYFQQHLSRAQKQNVSERLTFYANCTFVPAVYQQTAPYKIFLSMYEFPILYTFYLVYMLLLS